MVQYYYIIGSCYCFSILQVADQDDSLEIPKKQYPSLSQPIKRPLSFGWLLFDSDV